MSLNRLRNFLNSLAQFVRNVANDERIPSRDKTIVLVALALILSPVDLIPDWIPVLGWMDDLLITAIVLDYFFNVLDQNILLSHYPWGMKSYVWLRRFSRTITFLTPEFVKKYVWKYRPDPLSSQK